MKLNILNETGLALTFTNNGANSLRSSAETLDKMLSQAPDHLAGELRALSQQLWALWDHAMGVNNSLAKIHTELRTGQQARL